MKILFVASQTPSSETLALEREINDIQRQLTEASLSSAQVIFLPDLTLEDLPIALSRYKPDVLHISVHGERKGLWFAKEAFDGGQRQYVSVSGKALGAFLDPLHRPKLVFLNACESQSVAKELSHAGVAAIGTSKEITNQAAVAASRLLYDRLLGGRPISEAFDAVDQLVRTMENGTELRLCAPPDVDAGSIVLNSVPRLAARLAENVVVSDDEPVAVQIGVVGCPPETSQITFFTNDPSFITDDDNLEADLSEIVRDNPRDGEVWTETIWTPWGDFRLAACGITTGGATFSLSGMLGDALEQYARVASPPAAYIDQLHPAVARLRNHDGSGLAVWTRKAKRKNKRS